MLRFIVIIERYTFQNVTKVFALKTAMSFNSFNIISAAICEDCLEQYIEEISDGKTRLRDRVRVYTQHVKQQKHQ